MGYTCDWERSRFTLDDQYVRAIRLVFKTLFDEGLVYRGPRIVNWCPGCCSAISDEEIDWQEHTDTLYYLKYPVDGGGTSPSPRCVPRRCSAIPAWRSRPTIRATRR